MSGPVRSVAVSGADGFVGRRLCDLLESRGRTVVRLVRRAEGQGRVRRVVPDLAAPFPLAAYLQDVQVVVHLAGRAHVLRPDASEDEAFRRSNVTATIRLAHAAVDAGVQRLVFVSTIGVNGDQTRGVPFTEADIPAPSGPYSRSKWEAECALRSIAGESGLQVVIVRPPLVYGAAAPGNFARLVRLAASGWPLPLARIVNRRSLIGLENLCDFLAICSDHASAPGEVFLVAEPEPRSTPELLITLAAALGRPVRLIPVPLALLRAVAAAVGRSGDFHKLCGSLEVSMAKAQSVLGWSPKFTFADEVRRIASWHAGDWNRG